MRFSARPAGRERREGIVPMINVVFLLLVFLLMTAEMTPPAPLEVRLPEAGAPPAPPGEVVLHLSADGALALGDLAGEAALAALGPGAVVHLRADAGLPAADLARLLPRLAAAGVADLRLVTEAR